MTDLEKAQLTELAERAWRCAPEGHEEFRIETLRDVSYLLLPKGFSVIRNRELFKVIREWNHLKENRVSPKKEVIQVAQTLDLETRIKNGFGLVKDGHFEIGDFFVFHKGCAGKVAVLAVVLGSIVGFILGVLATALFNWIF